MSTLESNCRMIKPEALLRMLLIQTPDCQTISDEMPVFWIDMPRVLGDHYAFGTQHRFGLEGKRQSMQTCISVATPHTQYVVPSPEATEPVLLLTVFLAPQVVFEQMDLAVVSSLVDQMARLDGADQTN
ncbi:hypothetical protein [Fibrella forsythiae]|uniref:AraC family transcriptional regulator n=1 Tax=Fibrella forsythiae TaxID=2817061 RepID=A0ABS3JUE9_9BACT|nr:hypothetical protein [Fibrella forsythiae]MBO0953026.1 hypothetical protein [Fibrella forsythiae]